MANEEIAIKTEPLIEKLKEIKQLLPNETAQLYALADYLAKRLEGSSEIVPEGLILLTEKIFYEMEHRGCETELPPELHDSYASGTLRPKVTKIAGAVSPPDFAEEVLRICREMYRRKE